MTTMTTNQHASSLWSRWIDRDSRVSDVDVASIKDRIVNDAQFRADFLLDRAKMMKAVGNFVHILNPSKDIKVRYAITGESFANGKNEVTLSYDVEDSSFDYAVGLALHEGSHILHTSRFHMQHQSQFISDVLTRINNTRVYGGNDMAQQLIESEVNSFCTRVNTKGKATRGQALALANFVVANIPNALLPLDERGDQAKTAECVRKALKFWSKKMFWLFNVIEDRRIDQKTISENPGYAVYYKALYDKYWLDARISETFDKALAGELKMPVVLEAYIFCITNMINGRFNSGILPGLTEIMSIIDVKRIGRLKNSFDAADICYRVWAIIAREIKKAEDAKREEEEKKRKEQEKKDKAEQKKQDKKDKQDKQDQEDQDDESDDQSDDAQGEDDGEGDDQEENEEGEESKNGSDSEDSEETDDENESEGGDADDDEDESDGDDTEDEDSEGSAGDDSEETEDEDEDDTDGDSSDANATDDKSDEADDADESEDDDDIEGDTEGEGSKGSKSKSKKTTAGGEVDGDTKGEDEDDDDDVPELTPEEMEEMIEDILDMINGEIEKAGTTQEVITEIAQVGQLKIDTTAVDYAGMKVPVKIYKNIKQVSGIIPHGQSVNNPLNVIAVKEGILLGKRLGGMLQFRRESRTDVSSHLVQGRFDKRLLYSAGFGVENIFQTKTTSQFKDIYVRLSIDASGSMRGEKLAQACKLAAMIVTALSQYGSHVVIDVRGNDYHTCNVVEVFNSKFHTEKALLANLARVQVAGATPESLCFAAIEEDMKRDSQGKESYFINISDGEPGAHLNVGGSTIKYEGPTAVAHCAAFVRRLEKSGTQVLSYFISNSYVRRVDANGNMVANADFLAMYGGPNNAHAIDVKDVAKIAKALNKKLLRAL